jgi:hypothetical protein
MKRTKTIPTIAKAIPPSRCGSRASLWDTGSSSEDGAAEAVAREDDETVDDEEVDAGTDEEEPRTIDREEERDEERRREVLTLGTYSDILQRKAATTVA